MVIVSDRKAIEQERMSQMKEKVNGGKTIVDAVTILLLFVAFIFAYVMGFVRTNSATGEYLLSTVIVALIAVGGLGILYFSGSVVELVSRIKRDRMNVGTVVSFSVATVAYIADIAVMLALLCNLTTVDSFLPRFVYLAAVIVTIGSYYASVVYSAKLEAETEMTEAEEIAEAVSEEEN